MPVKKVVGKSKTTWYYSFRVRGVRYRGAIPEATNKQQAEQAETKIRNEIYEGKFGRTTTALPLKEFVDQVYRPWAKSNKRSWKIDESRLKPIVDFFGKKRLNEINTFLVEKFKRDRKATPIIFSRHGGSETRERPRSIASVNRELCLLSKILSLAVTGRLISQNPCREVDLLKGEQPRTRYLKPDEEERLIQALTGPRRHMLQIVELYLNTGMREAELLRLPVHLVDFHREVIYVKNTKGDIDHDVPMNNRTRQILMDLVTKAQAKGYEFLFTNPKTEKPYTTIKTAWSTACRLAGITDLRIHDLRHTFGTRAADQGVPLSAIRDVMGHKSIKTTERYAHATDEAKRRAVEAAGRKPAKVVKIWPSQAVGE